MIEDEKAEFKREVTDNIAKAAVAFSNTEGGQILVGVDDNGNVQGLNNIDDSAISCAKILKDQMRPDITMTSKLRIEEIDGKRIISINIQEGPKKPYFLRDKGLRPEGVYLRRGTTNQPVTDSEFILMMQTIRSRNYETIESLDQELTFDRTSRIFKENGVLFSNTHMEILGMMKDNIYTNLAYMLSDQFEPGIKVAVYRDNDKSSFISRREFSGSVLGQFDDAFKFIINNTVLRSTIKGIERIDESEYPEEALREALLNAIIHRDYGITGTILVSKFRDRITISSPGALNEAYSIEDLKLGVSSSRNPKLALVFYRLKLVETYGSGIPRIMHCYKGRKAPEIKVGQSVFFVSLPSLFYSEGESIDSVIENQEYITRNDLESIGISRSAALKVLSDLETSGKIIKEGNGRSTRYRIIR